MGASLKIIEDNSLSVTEAGFGIKVRLNWYRSLPLSCVTEVKLTLDGELISPDLLSFICNNKEYNLDELSEQVNEYWYVQDSAKVFVRLPGKIKAGETHELVVGISLKMPYIPVGPGKFLTIPTFYKTVQLAS
ncbi:MAG: DUF6379 domain-containing protein [Ignavibacteria bacterium]|jgi:hypothetical protein